MGWTFVSGRYVGASRKNQTSCIGLQDEFIELRTSGTLQFHNQDVNTVFDISRAIYECDYDKINTVYGRMQITSELGVVIGAITQSQKLIDHALKLEQNGGQVNMCSALEELEKKAEQKGMIKGTIKTCKKIKLSREETTKNIIEEFSLSNEEAEKCMEMYW